MTTRVVTDPADLGWVLNEDTGRWEWSGAGAGGGGFIPEAPIDGAQYARKNATWDEVVPQGSAITVSCKYNGSELRYGKNVDRIEQQGGYTWVYFQNQVEGFDDHYAVTVTPFVYLGDNSAGRMAISVLTGFTSEWVQFITRVEVNGEWVDPTEGYGFSLLVVDIEQS
jgi:hypothetical protein